MSEKEIWILAFLVSFVFLILVFLPEKKTENLFTEKLPALILHPLPVSFTE